MFDEFLVSRLSLEVLRLKSYYGLFEWDDLEQ